MYKFLLSKKVKNFINVDVVSELDKAKVHSNLSECMPDFSWRMGESDMQGGYVSGRNEAGVHIQCWTDENPFAFTLSFSNTTLTELEATELVNRITQKVLPHIGEIKAIND
jgi:hypothetical protein